MMWTTLQNEVLRAYGHEGATGVQKRLVAECGVTRSIRAIEMQASRIHASLRVRGCCPECGVVGVYLNRQTGLCTRCTERQHVTEASAFNALLRRELEEIKNDPSTEENRREYNRLRQENSRICRKHGLANKSQREA